MTARYGVTPPHLDQEDLAVGDLEEARDQSQGHHQARVVQVPPVRVLSGGLVLCNGVDQGIAGAGVMQEQAPHTGGDGDEGTSL